MFETCDASQGGIDRAAIHAAVDLMLDAVELDAGHGSRLAEALVAAHVVSDAIDGARVAVLSEFEASAEWARDGHRSPVSWLVAQTGIHRKAGGGVRRVCLAASRMPHVSRAARAGKLSSAHLKLLADARRAPVAAEFDRCEAALVAAACQLSADDLRRHLARWHLDALERLGVNDTDADPGGTDGNQLRLRSGIGGRGLFDGELTPTAYATLAAAIDAELDRLRQEGALAHDHRTMSELAGDALIELIERGANRPDGAAARPLVIVHVDIDTLLRRARPDGAGNDDPRSRRIAELLGYGPITNAEVAELATRANLALLIRGADGQPLHYGRARRLATTAQRNTALALHDGHCYWPGCDAPAHRCDTDHLTGWTQDGLTDIENLAPLCRFHNRLKHRERFTARKQPDGTITVHHPNGTPITSRYPHPPPIWTEPPDPGLEVARW